MNDKVILLNISEIVPGNNDRRTFSEKSLRELAANIEEHGLIQPITVRWVDEANAYEIVAGERRYRAHQILDRCEIPAIVRDLTEEEASAIMLAENVGRDDLNPIEEAEAYQSRIDRFDWTISDLARHAGVSTIHIRFRLKLTVLRPDIQDLVKTGNLQVGYAQIIADASLDNNFQLQAIGHLRDNDRPTPAWFRRVCGELAEKQNQAKLFDDSVFFVPQSVQAAEQKEAPPHPETTTPPSIGNSTPEILDNMASYWQAAAESWDKLGKPFKRQECQAAAKAITLALATI